MRLKYINRFKKTVTNITIFILGLSLLLVAGLTSLYNNKESLYTGVKMRDSVNVIIKTSTDFNTSFHVVEIDNNIILTDKNNKELFECKNCKVIDKY